MYSGGEQNWELAYADDSGNPMTLATLPMFLSAKKPRSAGESRTAGEESKLTQYSTPQVVPLHP